MVLWFLIITSCNIIFRYKTSEETYRVWDFFQPSYLLTFKVCYDLFFIEKTHSSPNTLWKQCSLNVSTFTCTQNIWYRKKICFRVHKKCDFLFRQKRFDVAANVSCLYPKELSNLGKHCFCHNIFSFAGPQYSSKIFWRLRVWYGLFRYYIYETQRKESFEKHFNCRIFWLNGHWWVVKR